MRSLVINKILCFQYRLGKALRKGRAKHVVLERLYDPIRKGGLRWQRVSS